MRSAFTIFDAVFGSVGPDVSLDRLGKLFDNSLCNGDVKRLVKGLMIESYIEDGAQKPDGCVYGQSITDACLGWEKTERLILDLADKL